MSKSEFPPRSSDPELIAIEKRWQEKLEAHGIFDVCVRPVRKRGVGLMYHICGPAEAVAAAKKFLDSGL